MELDRHEKRAPSSRHLDPPSSIVQVAGRSTSSMHGAVVCPPRAGPGGGARRAARGRARGVGDRVQRGTAVTVGQVHTRPLMSLKYIFYRASESLSEWDVSQKLSRKPDSVSRARALTSEVFHGPLQAEPTGSCGASPWLSARAVAEHRDDAQYVEHHGDCVQGAGREQLRRPDPCSSLGTTESPQQSEDSAETEDTPNAHEANVEGAVAGARKH